MQAWTSPTRADVDRIHAQGKTVDIGVLSLRNILSGRIRPKRLLVGCFMLIVALPLHLVFNSAVYRTVLLNGYSTFAVTPEFEKSSFIPLDADFSGRSLYNLSFLLPTEAKLPYSVYEQSRKWEKLPIVDLINRYRSNIPQRFRHVVLVANHPKHDKFWENNKMEADGVYFYSSPYGMTPSHYRNFWLCRFLWRDDDPLDPMSCFMDNFSTDRPITEEPIGYFDERTSGNSVMDILPMAYSEVLEPDCRLAANTLYWWITTASNALIACCLTGMLFVHRSPPLVTIGDAIDSFLSEPSSAISKSACGYSRVSFRDRFVPPLAPAKSVYGACKERWWTAVSLMRWSLTTLWCFLLVVVLFVVVAVNLSTNGQANGYDFGEAMRKMYVVLFLPNIDLGIRPVDLDNFLYQELRTTEVLERQLQLVVIANIPQVFISISYLIYNTLLTTMLVEREWHYIGARKASDRKLRVSQPRGKQRSTFFLSVPYRYALPLLVLSTAEKWLASQTIFFTAVDEYGGDGNRRSGNLSTSTLLFSNLAMFCLLIVLFLSWVGLFVLGVVRSFPAGKPMLGACSRVIAASCHLPVEVGADSDVAAGAISWGAIRSVDRTGREEKWLGYAPCDRVEKPVELAVYG
ncbi:hypothetical protein QBC37DRAFT_315312 [Rhypophila decipiens]|uniref:DUF6536 domain-containing protein n=1 Tax=Rhypophila decipiens TaxID=261697 RepID=A0AAN6Y842_9PEZI|nr:hypothetical protein QBC37DRAFT_315312 [Rhypophila decipiens]